MTYKTEDNRFNKNVFMSGYSYTHRKKKKKSTVEIFLN